MTKLARERYQLTIEAQPSEVPAVNRQRRLLKALLRGYAFKCIDLEAAR
jgi:hypothetical protein